MCNKHTWLGGGSGFQYAGLRFEYAVCDCTRLGVTLWADTFACVINKPASDALEARRIAPRSLYKEYGNPALGVVPLCDI